MGEDELGDAGLIDRITGLDRQASWVAAGQLRAIAELAKRRVACWGSAELGFVVDELALALTCSRYSAWARLQTALDLVDRLPATRALTDVDTSLVEDEVLPAAEVLTPAKLRVRVAAAAAAVDPREADEAHEDACASRTVRKYSREHGMTGIWALLPADHAAAVWAAVNTHAETTRQPGDQRSAEQRRADSLTDLMTAYLDGTCPTELPGSGIRRADPPDHRNPDTQPTTGPIHARPTDSQTGSTGPTDDGQTTSPQSPGPTAPTEHRAATGPTESTRPTEEPSTDCTTASPGRIGSTGSAVASAGGGCQIAGGHRPPKVPAWCRVQVKISADWLLGHSTEAPVLTGHGPLPADVALRLIADAKWQRIVYDPLTGALLDVGTTVHDPPPPLREHVLVRDGGCTQPICGNPRVDLDHNLPHAHGPTSAGNLRSRCRHDHRLKQHPAWQVRVGDGGRIDWITPVDESLARSAHRPVRSSGRGRPCDAPGLSAAGHAYPEHQPDLRPGPTATPRPDPAIGAEPAPDPPDDPPPF